MRIAFGDDFVSFKNSYLLYLKLKKILEYIISFSETWLYFQVDFAKNLISL